MQRMDEQVQRYHEDGYLFLPEFFSPREVEALREGLAAEFAEESERRILEKGTQVVRSVYGSHKTNPVFARLVRDARLLEPAKRIVGDEVYVHQFKINAKLAFVGDVWEWHQDYIFWRNEDGMPSADIVSVMLFLDDVTEFNGPLLLIPGSHREGVIDVPAAGGMEGGAAWMSNLTADLKYSIRRETLARLVERGGIVAPKGPAGSVLFFHGNVVHGSSPNMSPFDRRVAIITYNSVSNVPGGVAQPRPDFLSSRDHAPLEPVPA